jgi:hypothetical protein
VSGHTDALELVAAGALERGALKAARLAVSGAFHTVRRHALGRGRAGRRAAGTGVGWSEEKCFPRGWGGTEGAGGQLQAAQPAAGSAAAAFQT